MCRQNDGKSRFLTRHYTLAPAGQDLEEEATEAAGGAERRPVDYESCETSGEELVWRLEKVVRVRNRRWSGEVGEAGVAGRGTWSSSDVIDSHSLSSQLAVGWGAGAARGRVEEAAPGEEVVVALDEPNLRASFLWFRSWRPAATASA